MKITRCVITILFCLLVLCSCHEDTQSYPTTIPTDPSVDELTYTIEIVGPEGRPMTDGVIVNFIQGNVSVGKNSPNADGKVEIHLPKGTYTVELCFANPEVYYHHNAPSVVLTSEQPYGMIIVANEPDTQENRYTQYDPVTGEEVTFTEQHDYVGMGYTYLPLESDKLHYVYFVPTEPGLYRFSVADEAAALGYYGSPYFVREISLVEPDADGSVTVNISKNMIGIHGAGTSVLVLGVNADEVTQCFLYIERIDQPELTIEDFPWDIYETTVALTPFTLPKGTEVEDFDLTADSDAYKLVLNSTDGFYHLGSADGPLVYAKLGTSTAHLDAIETILQSSAICRYFFDENGNFQRKESYTECLLHYIAHMDLSSGLYPLTQDLMFIFRQYGEYAGWWDLDEQTNLFVGDDGKSIPGVNAEIAWLFLCCYRSN